MALHWAWAFNIRGTNAQYAASGWGLTHGNINTNYSSSPLPRQPLLGHGGMERGVQCTTFQTMTTPSFPAGALSDGQIQFHLYGGFRGTSRIRLVADDNTVLLELRPSDNTQNPAIDVYSGEGSMSYRDTTTGRVLDGCWNVWTIRFKVGASGAIAISINNNSETIIASGDVGATSSWAKLQVAPQVVYGYLTGITVWDDGAGDSALTTTYWVAGLRPYQDDTDGAWTPSTGADLYATIIGDLSTAEYDTTTSGSEMRVKIRTSDIDASWSPLSIPGINIVASMRGDGTLNTGQTVIDDGVSSNAPGTARTLTTTTQFYLTNDAHPKQADGSSAWTVGTIDSHTYGVIAS